MTFTEAARIMMTKSPVSSGGIWDMFDGREPLAVITLGPKTLVYVLDMGVPLNSSIAYGNNGQYVSSESNMVCPYAVLRYNNKFIAYYGMPSNMGYPSVKQYTPIGNDILMTLNRRVKFGATKVSQCKFSTNGDNITFSLSMKNFLDYLNFSQYNYDDGSHWEETYAWFNGPFSYSYSMSFAMYHVSYHTNVLGDTIGEQYNIWNSVSKDIIENSNKGFPIISYTKPEDHFDNAYYINDDAKNRGYYDSNVAYMEKWGTPELWA